MPTTFSNQTPGSVARALLGTLLMLWLVTGSNLFGYRYWNVTQDKYEAALVKWHSLPIEEYAATLKMVGSGTWKIVVHVERKGGTRVEKVTSVEASMRLRRAVQSIGMPSILKKVGRWTRCSEV